MSETSTRDQDPDPIYRGRFVERLLALDGWARQEVARWTRTRTAGR